ncbi:MAG TPA: tryptophan halogenase family protein [Steroidobacteraceae bacterium]|jgi:tryptophan halogenase|nr:tryptophan halogenase family protein [Steroidobacteraceae bacterium]
MHYVIVGGGSAGWMTAAALAHALKGSQRVTLVESDEIGTVGVGEATIPPLQFFNKVLGINEREFIRATQASFKLGIEFHNWGHVGHRYFHQFGEIGANIDGISFHQFWLRLAAQGHAVPIGEYAPATIAASHGRFLPPFPSMPQDMPQLAYAYHFDAGLYARFLRNYAEQRGVVRVEGRIAHVDRNGASGLLEALRLADGRVVAGDFFLDCSGFAALLIERTLQTGYVDWSHWLPCNRALAVPCEKNPGDFVPYTRSTARDAGWQWRIPLQHRTGNGHVYCSDFIGDDEAARVLLANLDGAALADARPLRFITGRRRKFWNGNCVALGLAAGFMEPLESTSLHLVQSAIFRFLSLLPLSATADPTAEEEFNRLSIAEFEQIRDFIILHYAANERDEPFWRYCRTMSLPDSLAHRLDLFRARGKVARHDGQLFSDSSWIAIMLGQGVRPRQWDPLADVMPLAEVQEQAERLRNRLHEAISRMPTHAQFIENNCKAA